MLSEFKELHDIIKNGFDGINARLNEIESHLDSMNKNNPGKKTRCIYVRDIYRASGIIEYNCVLHNSSAVTAACETSAQCTHYQTER